jgi:hypothetical protein
VLSCEGSPLDESVRLARSINTSGGYTGFLRYVFIFKDGVLAAVWGEEPWGGTSFSTHMTRLK